MAGQGATRSSYTETGSIVLCQKLGQVRYDPTMTRHLLLTGPPGCGKTTVAMAVLNALREAARTVFGFWTQEIRAAGVRTGFSLELLSGGKGVLASVERRGPPRVGKYGVNVGTMDQLVVPEIGRAVAATRSESDVVLVMDEIGKMELLSQSFQQAVVSAFDSPVRILATVMARPHPFADALKRRTDALLLTVTFENRDQLVQQIIGLLTAGMRNAPNT